jgi:methyl coenzyme M reductase subunit D
MKTRKLNPFISALNSALDDRQKSVNEMRNNINEVKSKKLELRVKYGRLFTDLPGSFSISLSCEKPVAYVSMRRLESFKDARLTDFLDKLVAMDGEMSSTDYASIMNRSFTCNFSDFQVYVDAYVKDDSPTCRKVVIGTKIEEVLEYEIVCD